MGHTYIGHNYIGYDSHIVMKFACLRACTRTHTRMQEFACTPRPAWKWETLSEAAWLELARQPFEVLQKRAHCLETLSLTSLQFGIQAELFHRDALTIKGALFFVSDPAAC